MLWELRGEQLIKELQRWVDNLRIIGQFTIGRRVLLLLVDSKSPPSATLQRFFDYILRNDGWYESTHMVIMHKVLRVKQIPIWNHPIERPKVLPALLILHAHTFVCSTVRLWFLIRPCVVHSCLIRPHLFNFNLYSFLFFRELSHLNDFRCSDDPFPQEGSLKFQLNPRERHCGAEREYF